MKLDIKSILILILLTGCLIFGYMSYFRTNNSDYKNQIKQLNIENEMLKKQRDSIDTELGKLEDDFTILKSNELSYIEKIKNLDSEIENAKSNANRSRSELNRLKGELNLTKKRIQDLKNNPPILEGDDLLNSLKNNSQK
jgi:chromosome segregation ATPase